MFNVRQSTSEKSALPTYPDCRRKQVVADLVAKVAEERPHAVALTTASAQLSYGELNARANVLAGYLRSLGSSPEVLVGICLERSFDQIISILAVMKSGGAFLPLDPAWPASCLRKLLDDAQAPLVVTSAEHAELLMADGRTAIVPGRDQDKIASAAGSEIVPKVRRENLAYVIYTSGSTGEPKGAEVTHGNLLNLIFWHRSAFGVTAADRASHLAGLGFDASVWEVWPYLTAGATVVLVDETTRTSPDLLRRFIIDEKINVAFVPTALAEPMIAADWPADTALRFLLTGADTLHGRPRTSLPFTLINNYGPTECTVVATSGPINAAGDSQELPSIGMPIANTKIYLLDEKHQPVAAGEVGEIYIGGTGVGRGYRNRGALTAERFLPDPFRPAPDARMYRTGDLGRLRQDSQIGFHGRVDNQEKFAAIASSPKRSPRRLTVTRR